MNVGMETEKPSKLLLNSLVWNPINALEMKLAIRCGEGVMAEADHGPMGRGIRIFEGKLDGRKTTDC